MKINVGFLSLFMITIMEVGACQNIIAPGLDFGLFDKTPVRELAKAVKAEDTLAMIELTKSNKINIDFQEPRFGQTLLTLAITTNKIVAIKQLLKLHANPNIKSPVDDKSPFINFCFYSSRFQTSSQVLNMLIDYGGDVNTVEVSNVKNNMGVEHVRSVTALRYICTYGNLATLKIMIEKGASLDIYPVDGDKSLITTVVFADNLDMLKYLLIEKKVKIPSYCFIRNEGVKNERKMTITDVLNEADYKYYPQNAKLKEEILSFIKMNEKK